MSLEQKKKEKKIIPIIFHLIVKNYGVSFKGGKVGMTFNK